MTERPILFSDPMVRAILAGTKTQTRRVVRKQFGHDAEPAEVPATSPEGWQISGHSGLWWDDCAGCIDDAIRCPYGQPGDRLWVRETWQQFSDDGQVMYRADPRSREEMNELKRDECLEARWRPSIHMPRRLSRILLEIVAVRVERLNDISDRGPQNDCTAEGVYHCGMDCPTYEQWHGAGFRSAEKFMYRQLWESINGPGSWDSNPWVWVVEFKRVQS